MRGSVEVFVFLVFFGLFVETNLLVARLTWYSTVETRQHWMILSLVPSEMVIPMALSTPP